MVNRIGTIYPCGLTKGFSLRFGEGFLNSHETPEEHSQNTESITLKMLSDKNYLASSQKFRQKSLVHWPELHSLMILASEK